MYCPRCATQNLDDAKYCRACGADIHLVPQALTGTLPAELAKTEGGKKPRRRSKKEKDEDPKLLEKGMENVFVGLAFLIIFLGGLFYFRGAYMIWIWFIIPSLACFGEGFGQLLRSKREQSLLAAGLHPRQLAAAEQSALQTPRAVGELSAPDTAEIAQSPFSVTEATTRHLDGRVEKAPEEA